MSSRINSELFERIRFIRKILRWTQEDLGKAAGVSRVSVSQWESKDPTKRTQPEIPKLRAISEASGFPFHWLIEDSSELKIPEGMRPPESVRLVKKAKPKENPLVDRLQAVAATISDLSPDGGSDEVLVSTLQILNTYRRTLQEAQRKNR